jgi:hypothetical protein
MSGSLSESPGPGDLPLFNNFLDFDDDRVAKKDSSSIVDMVVAVVAVEFDRCENFIRLPSPVLVVCV